MRTCVAALAFGLVAFMGQALASERHDCAGWDKKALSQNEMNMCAAQDFDDADKAMNTAYRQVTGRLGAEAKVLLVEAQRAWIVFRDSECKYEAAENEGGSIYPMVYSGCMARLTLLRVRDLKDWPRQ